METNVKIETGKAFWTGSGGKWAGEQLMKALAEGKPLTTAALRTNATLRKDEWIAFDEALLEEAQIRLRGVADLLGAGLVIPVADALGKTVFQYEKMTDMESALVSLDGAVKSENERVDFELAGIPLPITHKDFYLNLRTLTASRGRGESLDTTQVRVCGRLIAEETERMLFQGSTKVYVGLPIYGYTTHPDRNELNFPGGEVWDAVGKTGEEILTDVLNMILAAEADRMYGPYWLYLPRAYSTVIERDFKANSDKTVRQRLLEIEGLRAVRVVDQLLDANVVLVQATRDVAAMVDGVPLQTVQWDVEGGFIINFKAFQIQIPLIRSDSQHRSGVVHMHV